MILTYNLAAFADFLYLGGRYVYVSYQDLPDRIPVKDVGGIIFRVQEDEWASVLDLRPICRGLLHRL
jgi:hypothetical protein